MSNIAYLCTWLVLAAVVIAGLFILRAPVAPVASPGAGTITITAGKGKVFRATCYAGGKEWPARDVGDENVTCYIKDKPK